VPTAERERSRKIERYGITTLRNALPIFHITSTHSACPAVHLRADGVGLTWREAVGLSWENVDLERGVVSFVSTIQRLQGKGIVLQPPKSTAGRRGIAIDSGTVDMLRAHRGKQLLLELELGGSFQDIGFVFPGPFGGLLDPSVVARNFEKLAGKTGNAGVRLFDLRHGYAAGLIRAGVHPRVVQERLGHASAAFTMQVYGHVEAGLQQEAANAFAVLMQSGERGDGA